MPSSYTIGEHFEKLARDLVASGRYASVSEVLRDGLRLIEQRENQREAELDVIRAEIAEGMKGPFMPWNLEEAKREGRRLMAERSKRTDAA